MALMPSTAVSVSSFGVKALIGSPVRLQTCTLTRVANQRVSFTSSGKIVAAQFSIPDKAKMQMKAAKERLWKSLPDSIRAFPWKKVEDQALQWLISLGQETFKWSFLAWFLLSFLSDIFFTVSRNQELVMPFGLFVGCFLSDFMKETSEELFQQPQAKDVNWSLLSVASVFVILKLVSVFLALRGRIFLVHVANGGLMQILWLWRRFQKIGVELANSSN